MLSHSLLCICRALLSSRPGCTGSCRFYELKSWSRLCGRRPVLFSDTGSLVHKERHEHTSHDTHTHIQIRSDSDAHPGVVWINGCDAPNVACRLVGIKKIIKCKVSPFELFISHLVSSPLRTRGRAPAMQHLCCALACALPENTA